MSSYDGKEAARQVWGASPAGWVYSEGAAIGTREYFENVIRKRSTYELPWLAEVFPFDKTRGKKVLEVGCGAGYDAYEFCRNGANYTGVDITPENIERTKKHLSLVGFDADIRLGDAEHLDFPDESFDLAFSNGVLHHIPDIRKGFDEIHRILKPRGEFWLTLYHKNSVFYRLSICLWTHILRGGFLKLSLDERRSLIEYTASDARPIVNVYSKGEVQTLVQQARFSIEFLGCRKLVHEDFPGTIARLIRPVPQKWLDRLGRVLGWYVVVRARKS
jgi:ubiquinone/menaquinone biosynthesis C-methylase UbiE